MGLTKIQKCFTNLQFNIDNHLFLVKNCKFLKFDFEMLFEQSLY